MFRKLTMSALGLSVLGALAFNAPAFAQAYGAAFSNSQARDSTRKTLRIARAHPPIPLPCGLSTLPLSRRNPDFLRSIKD